MVSSTITAKGQTTIPIEVRHFLHLHSGDKIDYILQETGEVLLVPSNFPLMELKNILPRPKKKVSLEEMEEVIRAGWAGDKK